MINGFKITQIPLVRQNLQSHFRKLKQISKQHFNPQLSKSSQQESVIKLRSLSLPSKRPYNESFFKINEYIILQNKKQTHQSSKKWKKQRLQSRLDNQNKLIFDKLLKIDRRISPNMIHNNAIHNKINNKDNNPNNNRTMYRVKPGKDAAYRKKQKLAIQATNIEIAKRISTQNSFVNIKKDEADFSKTRLIVNRLQKFKTVKRLISISHRSKTLPHRLPKLYTEPSQQQSNC